MYYKIFRPSVISFFAIVSFVFSLVVPTFTARAQTVTSPEGTMPGNTFECTDLFRFGSVQVSLSNNLGKAPGGSNFLVTATITNENDYPIADGSVYVKVFKLQESDVNNHANGGDVVDQLVALSGINLKAHESITKNFSWKIPTYAITGAYQMVPYFLVGNQFNLLGLSFTDDIHGKPLDFSVRGDSNESISFNKNSIKVNNETYFAAAFPPLLNPDKDVTINTVLKNNTFSDQAIPVFVKVYRWDSLEEKNRLSETPYMVSLKKGENKPFTFTVKDKASVTLVVVEAQYRDTKSILNVRFVRTGLSYPRINFAGVAAYPLKAGEPSTVFTCVHGAGGIPVLPNGRVVMTLSDKSGNVLYTDTYLGPITGLLMGVKNNFTPSRSVSDFVLKTEVFEDGKLTDSSEVPYSCEQLNPGFCGGSSNINWMNVLGIFAIIIVLILVIVLLMKRMSKKGVGTALLILLLTLGIQTVFPKFVHAQAPSCSSGPRQGQPPGAPPYGIPGTVSPYVGCTGWDGCNYSGCPAVDLCPNIAGNQGTIPTGQVKDSAGNCVDYDACINIAGTQTSVPSGYVTDSSGICSIAATSGAQQNVSWTGNINNQTSALAWQAARIAEANAGNKSNLRDIGGGAHMEWTINTAQLIVSYGAQMYNYDTGATIPLNGSVPVGTKIVFGNTTFNNTDVSWTLTGMYYGTPYGYFRNNIGGLNLCTTANKFADMGPSGIDYAVGIVDNPSVSVNTSGSTATMTQAGNVYTVTGPGSIVGNVTFAPTSGGIYIYNSNTGSCTVSSPVFRGPFSFSVPQQTIAFNLTAVPVAPPNGAPATPTISGPTSLVPGVTGNYSVVSTDPDGDQIYYNIVYGGSQPTGSTPIDLVLPGVGSSVASGSAQPFFKSWPAGTYTIWAQAADNTSGGSSTSYSCKTVGSGGIGTNYCATDGTQAICPIISGCAWNSGSNVCEPTITCSNYVDQATCNPWAICEWLPTTTSFTGGSKSAWASRTVTVANPPDNSPEGVIDTSTCSSTDGWAFDRDTTGTSISVHFYSDGPAGVGTFIGATTANTARADVNTFYQTNYGLTIGNNHGYSFPTPASLKNGVAHTIYAYGINTNGTGPNPVLGNSPKTITCFPDPDVTISASPSVVAPGGASTLTWTPTNATTCTASNGWSGSKTASGNPTQVVNPAVTTTYTITCINGAPVPVSATDSVTVSVVPDPTVTVTPTSNTIASGASQTISWSSTGATTCTKSGGWSGTVATSGSTLVTPASNTTYTVTCTNSVGRTASASSVITVVAGPTCSVSASSVTIAAGGSSTLTWSTAGATSVTASGAWSGAKAASGSQVVTPASTATYNLTATNAVGVSCNGSVTVTVVPAPNVTISASPTTIAVGNSSTLTWSSTDATTCTASNGWSGSKALSGSQSVTPASTATYTITCTNSIGVSASASVTVTVVPVSTCSLSASPSTIAAGGSSTLTWSSSGAVSITASGGWSGSKTVPSGTQSVTPAVTTTYNVTCVNAVGVSTNNSVTVTVVPAPTVSISVSPGVIAPGNSSTVTWSTTNAVSCTATNGWSGSKALSGSQSVTPPSTTTYTLTCLNSLGVSASNSAVVNVVPICSINLWSDSSSVFWGGSTNINWTVTDASSITASGDWSGSKATSGSQSTGIMFTDKTYTLTCSSPVGTTARTIIVNSGTAPTCSDTLDNDGDGKTDYPADPGCTDANDTDETDPAAAIVNVSVSPTSVTSGQPTTVSWTTVGAASCTASGGTANWPSAVGAKPVSGSQVSNAISSNTTFTLTCLNSVGVSTSNSATVTVTGSSAPVITISASPNPVTNGGSSVITWSAAPATSCSASWTASTAVSGSQSVTPPSSANTTYSITCTNSGVPTTNSVVISSNSQCSDGIDNDGDGNIDYPADTDCPSSAGVTETTIAGFTVSISPSSVPIKIVGDTPATSQSSNVNVGVTGSFNSPITFSASASLPAGVTATYIFAPSNVSTFTGSGYTPVTLQVRLSGTVSAVGKNPIPVTVTGVGGGITVNSSFFLNPNAAPDFREI